MIALRLNQHQITNFGRLSQYFSVPEIICHKDAFLSFAKYHLVWEAIDRYHIQMLGAAMDEKRHCVNLETALDVDAYWKNPYNFMLKDDELVEVLESYMSNERDAGQNAEMNRELEKQIFNTISRVNLEEEKKRRLYFFLVAVYKLAKVDLKSKPLDLTKAIVAWLGQKTDAYGGHTVIDPLAGAKAEKAGEERGSIEEIHLLPGKNEYRLFRYAKSQLEEGKKIRTVRFVAERQGSRYGVVELRVYSDTRASEPDETIVLKQGEYIYANRVDGKLIKFLNTRSENRGASLYREHLSRNIIILKAGNEVKNYELEDISSFAVEHKGSGFLAIQNNRLITTYYSCRNTYTQLEIIEERQVVEVRIIEGDYLILQDTGRVYSSYREHSKDLKNIVDLDKVALIGGTDV